MFSEAKNGGNISLALFAKKIKTHVWPSGGAKTILKNGVQRLPEKNTKTNCRSRLLRSEDVVPGFLRGRKKGNFGIAGRLNEKYNVVPKKKTWKQKSESPENTRERKNYSSRPPYHCGRANEHSRRARTYPAVFQKSKNILREPRPFLFHISSARPHLVGDGMETFASPEGSALSEEHIVRLILALEDTTRQEPQSLSEAGQE